MIQHKNPRLRFIHTAGGEMFCRGAYLPITRAIWIMVTAT